MSKPSVNQTCQQCGATFLARIEQVKMGRAKFCSDTCYNATRTSKAPKIDYKPAPGGTLEKWLPVIGLEGLYEVSSAGRIRRTKTNGNTVAGHILAPKVGRAGYAVITLHSEGKKVYRTVHSLVADAFIGQRPEGKDVNHIDRNRLNNHIGNLEYVTAQENVAHSQSYITAAIKKHKEENPDRIARGSKIGTSKLTEDDVRQIRARLAQGHTLKSIGADFGVNLSAIAKIKYGESWAHVI